MTDAELLAEYDRDQAPLYVASVLGVLPRTWKQYPDGLAAALEATALHLRQEHDQ